VQDQGFGESIMIVTTLIQAVSAILPSAPPAPPALPAPPSPPMIYAVHGGEGRATERYVVDVDVRADGALVWAGALRVASNAQASFRRDQTEAEESDCGIRGGYRPGVQTGFSLQLRPSRFGESDSTIAMSLRWTRPGAARCPVQSSTRTIEMNDSTGLKPGETVTLKGDGGLAVKLHRRP